MKPNCFARFFSAQRLALAGLLMCGITAAWAADYASLITQAREQLQNERFTEALATAQEAVLAKPQDYKGHYYLAMTQMSLGQFDAAEAEAATALSQAPKSARPAVEKLAQTIKTNRKNADAASSNAESLNAAKELFLSCDVTEATDWMDGREPLSHKFNYVYKIQDNSIDEWNDKKYTWDTSFCRGKSRDEMGLSEKAKDFHDKVACSVNPGSITREQEYDYVSQGVTDKYKCLIKYNFLINRKTGKYITHTESRCAYNLGDSSTESHKSRRDGEGTCKLTSDPASAVGNKF